MRINKSDKTIVKASTKSDKKFTGKGWNQFVADIESNGYTVDSSYRSKPSQWIILKDKDGNSYDAEVTKYSDGDYELMTYNITNAVDACGDIKSSTYNDKALQHIKAAIDILGKSGNKDDITKDSIANLATVMFDIKANTVTASKSVDKKNCKVTDCTFKRLSDNWVGGDVTLSIKDQDDVKYTYEAKVFDDPSDYGINDGRVSKLWIKNVSTKNVVCNYDRGWDIKPSDAPSKVVYKYVVDYLEKSEKLFPEDEE